MILESRITFLEYRVLEKIIQHPIPIRPLFIEDVERLLESALKSYPGSLPSPDSGQQKVFDELKRRIGTPREIKRLIGSFAIIREAVQNEICPYDALAYAWMITRSPTLHKAISENLDRLVDDPSEQEMSDRVVAEIDKKPLPTVTDILGENASPYSEIVKLIFPRFGKEREADLQQGIRLSRRQNLIRILYLGDPPNAISRRQVEDLWSISDPDSLKVRLHELSDDNLLTDFIDRLDDFIVQLDPAMDDVFWPTMCSFLERDTDWVTEPNINRGIAEDVATFGLGHGFLRQF